MRGFPMAAAAFILVSATVAGAGFLRGLDSFMEVLVEDPCEP